MTEQTVSKTGQHTPEPWREEKAALLVVLAEVLSINPRPVKVPDTDMTLAVSYTAADLEKLANAHAAIAKGGAPSEELVSFPIRKPKA